MSIYNSFSFIEKANIIHNSKYDYSHVVFKNMRCKVCIKCPTHGLFVQAPIKHLQKQGCPRCGLESRIEHRRKGGATFVKEAQQIHICKDGTPKYDYTKVDYKNSGTKVIIICPIHGEFAQVANSHIRGIGCRMCGIQLAAINRTNTQNEIIKKFKEVHPNLYVYDKVKYVKDKLKVTITCIKHGNFDQTPHNHLSGHGCPMCKSEIFSNKYRKTALQFIEAAKIKHLSDEKVPKYIYDAVIYKSNKIPVKIFCKKQNHGYFYQKPNAHLNGQGCPKCDSSKGEDRIRNYLKLNDVCFLEQYRFNDCKDKRSLPFDFIISKDNKIIGAIEFQGLQHFKSIGYFGGTKSFQSQQRRDNIKRSFCADNQFKLLEISYKEINHINILLHNFLNTL
jgi:hypothetical protein